MTIDCGKIIGSKIAEFTCEIEGNSQKIIIEKEGFNSNINYINLKEIKILKLDYSNTRNTYNTKDIQNSKDIKKEGIYICPFGHWNYQAVKYIQKSDTYGNKYYKLDQAYPPSFEKSLIFWPRHKDINYGK